MFVVRYVALVALAIWVGGMVAPFWMIQPAEVPPLSGPLAYACGGTELVSLFVLKFVGPPPRAFPVRAVLVVLMLGTAAAAQAMRVTSVTPVLLNVTAGLVLLSWNARE
jgi:hypothetical protein